MPGNPDWYKIKRGGDLKARRMKAFEDYWALGPNRSIAALLRRYREIAQAEGPEAVPTLSRAQLDRWARMDNWEERALERDRRVYKKAQVELEEGRAGVFKVLGEYVGYALRVLERILTGEEKASAQVKLQAVKLLFDVYGLKAEAKNSEEKRELPSFPPPPAPDAPEEEFEKYYRRLLGLGKENLDA